MSNLKPWTTNDMIENASNWSLAGDARLLGYLESFSEELLSKAELTNENLNKLMGNLNNTSLSLDIVKKEFFSLHNTQFIESRVYEDDYSDSITAQDHSVEDKNVDEDKGIDWKEAIQNGIEVVNNYFDRVEVPASDSEDETDFPSYILRPKDLYADRHLPYVIGSEEWHKKWHVGLLDTSSESEDENVLDKFSESDSDDLNINNRIKFVEDTESVSDVSHNVTAKHPVANSTFEDMINNSDLFGSNDSAENNNSVSIQASVSTNSFAHELARKLGNVIEQNPKIVEPEVNRKPIQSTTSSRVIGNLFDDEPPPLDEDDIFGGNAQKGLFSGGAGLFDDISSDASWNKDKNLLREDQEKGKVPKQKLPDLFSDDNDDLFSGTNKKPETGYIKPELSQFKKAPSGNLFDDQILDDDDDLFKDTISNPYKKSYLPSTNSSGMPYFSNEPPELNLPSAVVDDSKKTDKKPIGGVKIFGDTDILGKLKINDLKPATSKTAVNISDVSTAKDIPILKKSSDLFYDSHSGSINSQRITETNEREKFERIDEPSKINDTEHPSTNPQAKKPIYLFDDEDDLFGDDLFSNISVKKFTSDLFSDEIVNDNLFAPDNTKLFHENLGFTSPKKTSLNSDLPNIETEKVQETEYKKSESPQFSSNKLGDLSSSEVFKEKTNNASIDSQNSDSNTTQVQNLSININLFDQNPPELDDGWDSKSDNLFDDNENLFDSTSVVTDHRSGLFDDEPPSLFSESSGIVRDMSYTRVETDDSFNPVGSSSRRFSTDIFNEQQSNDSFFVTRNRSNIEHRTQSHLDRIPEITNNSGYDSSVDVTPSGNVNNLFTDSTFDNSSQQSNITDDLFSQDASNIKPLPKFITENVEVLKTKSDDLFSSSKTNISSYLESREALDDTKIFKTTESEKKSAIFGDIDSDIFSTEQDKKLKEEFTDNSINNEQAASNTNVNIKDNSETNIESFSEPADVMVSTDDFASKIGSPGKLKHNLNINVSALIPGRGIVTKKDMSRTKSVESDLSPEKIINVKQAENSKDIVSSDQVPQLGETSTQLSENEAQILSNITKDRAKIPVKRRPSTRKARQESIRNSIADFRINVPLDSSPVEVNGVSLNKETEEKSTIPTANDKLPKEILENKGNNILKPNEKIFENTRPKSFTSSSLFDDPEDCVSLNKETEEKSTIPTTNNNLPKEILENKSRNIVKPNENIFENPRPKSFTSSSLFGDPEDFVSLNKETEEKSTISTTNNSPKEILENKSSNIVKPNDKNLENTKPKNFTSSSLFDDPEDFDDLFSSIKLPPKSTILKQSLFDDENDDDDIFGNSMGLNVKAKSNASTSKVETKKPPKAAQITKLENTSVVEDPLSLFLE